MRLIRARRLNQSVEKKFRYHRESRDAIVWDIDEVNQLVRVKIQGSNEYIYCYYPQNWEVLPYYCKPGMAVRIIHKGGNKNMLEIVGPGRAIPTPVTGSQLPPTSNLPDEIISGGGVTPLGLGSLCVQIEFPMTYRIDGVIYEIDISGQLFTMDGGSPPLTMGDSPEIFMGEMITR